MSSELVAALSHSPVTVSSELVAAPSHSPVTVSAELAALRLVYSEVMNDVFCLPCALFGTIKKVHEALSYHFDVLVAF